MGTKEKLLALLEAHKGEYFSGEEIAERLEISRTAVWKAANSLRKAGFAIDAVQNRGYCLDAQTDLLTENGIRKYLDSSLNLQIEVMAVTPSTNSLLRERANAGEGEGCVILANEQTKGRGRLGREFYSPPDSGIYMSLLLRPQEMQPSQAVRLTTMAAVAACDAIEEVSGRETGIKWVNDIFIDGKKVSGILTEAAMNLESGSMDYIILGIGLNVYEPEYGFPGELRNIAGSILKHHENDGKNRIAAAFLNHFMKYYTNRDDLTYTDKYREKSFVIGKEINIISPTESKVAYALDVDRDCRLIVRYQDGTIAPLSSSEISIRT